MPTPPCLAAAGPDGLSLKAEERGIFDSRLRNQRGTSGQSNCSNGWVKDGRYARASMCQVQWSTAISLRVLSEIKVGGVREVQVSACLAILKVTYTA